MKTTRCGEAGGNKKTKNQLSIFLAEYQEAAARTDQNPQGGLDGLALPLLGLFGEIGTLLSALKKKRRDGDCYVGYREVVLEEFGDVLWYLSNIASRASLSLASLLKSNNLPYPSSRRGSMARPEPVDSPEFEAALITLAGHAGALLNEFSSGKLQHDPRLFAACLSNVFSSLLRGASAANVDLRDAAENNIRKINSRWPRIRQFAPLFDEHFRSDEQLPREIEMHIVETTVGGKTCVIQLCNGVEIGSRLTDNKIVADDYRFHDVFHLAYAAVLGWSPCLRALLRAKRKSKPEIDESQDGARAILIEEGVATLIFHHAVRLNFFASVRSLDYSLLKTIRDFVGGYEVDQVPLWQWEQAILEGFRTFRNLRLHRRGIVTANLCKRSITFKPTSNDR
jgi:NTP pyrophosphatase (non-canonical NTP hydrolase)